jgi:hypothetical protein
VAVELDPRRSSDDAPGAVTADDESGALEIGSIRPVNCNIDAGVVLIYARHAMTESQLGAHRHRSLDEQLLGADLRQHKHEREPRLQHAHVQPSRKSREVSSGHRSPLGHVRLGHPPHIQDLDRPGVGIQAT